MLSLGLPSVISSVLNGISYDDGEEDLVIRHAALFSIQYACGMSWIDSGVKPQAICGHSFGEWAALTISGALSLEAGMKLVTGRAAIIKKLWGADTGSMVAIEADLVSTNTKPMQHLQFFLDKNPEIKVDVACYNGPNNYVVAGSTEGIEVLAKCLQNEKSGSTSHSKLRFKVLRGMHAYHSYMADSIVEECAKLSASIQFRRPTLPFVSCHQSDEHQEWDWTGPTTNIIPRNTRGPVYFGEAMQRIVGRLGQSCTFLEAGVGGPIIAMAQNALPTAEHAFVSISGRDPRQSLAAATATMWKSNRDVQFWPFHHSQSASFRTPQRVSLDLPPYQFEKHRHWTELKKTRLREAGDEGGPMERLCHRCQKSAVDFPYIIRERSQSQFSTDSSVSFCIDTRSRRYQQLVGGHVVVESPLCPAAMYLELAAHAVVLLRGGISMSEEIVVQSIQIKAPLGLNTQRSVKCTLRQKQQNTWSFDIFSTLADSIDNVISHGAGVITCAKIKSDEDADATYKWQRMSNLLDNDRDTEALRGALVYKVFASMVKYSTPYRGLRHLVGKGSEGSGEIEMPKDQLDLLAQTPNESITDVLVVDNFMQVAGIFVHSLLAHDQDTEDEQSNTTSYICTGMGIVRPLNGLPGSGKYRAYTKIVRDEGRAVVLDLFAFDRMTQRMIWSAQGLKFARVPRSSLMKALTGANLDSLDDPTQQSSSQEQPGQLPEDTIFGEVQDILSKCLDVPVAEVRKEALLEELGSDSLVSPEILVGISNRLKVDISTSDLAAVAEVASLCELISSRFNGNGHPSGDSSIDNASSPRPDSTDCQSTIVDILSEALDLEPAEIDPASKLEDLGADSLVAPEIISNLKTALGLEISSVDFAAAPDVISLCRLVNRASMVNSNNHGSSSSSTPTTHTPVSDVSGPVFDGQQPATKSTGGINASSMHTAFLQARRNFDTHATATGFTGYWDHVYPDQLRAVATFIVEAFEKLGCRIRDFDSGDTLPGVHDVLPKYSREKMRLWQILAEAGIVAIRGESHCPVYIRGETPLDKFHDAQEQSTRLCSEFPSYSAVHGLLALLGPHLAECLTGKENPVSLLFGSDHGRRLLDGFYGHAPDVRAATRVLCDFLSAAIHSNGREEPFQILEIGAGTGGTTKHLLPLLQATGLPFTYTFTDLSVSLVARARKTDFKDIMEMEFLKLNVEEEPPQELQGRYHVVVSANCVHATRDVRQCLRNIRKLVRPHDGAVVLLELIQQLPWYDLVWGLLDGWWLFDDDRQYPLLTPWAWERAMHDSGFVHVDWSEGSSRESRTLGIIAGFAEQDEQLSRQLSVCPAKATSMLLYRGPPSSSRVRNLFLAPDGAGYGTVFNHLGQVLAQISPGICVYALNSPFMTVKPSFGPEQHPPSVEEMAASYTAEIKRRQPQGPYLIGGYSFGGIVVYEAVRQLLEAGDEVEKLVLLDVPCPTSSACMSDALIRYVSAIISPGDISLARQQLELYHVKKLPGRKLPRTVLVSARDGVDSKYNNQQDREFGVLPEHRNVTDWLLNDRMDDGPLGWEELMGEGNVEVIRADGHHYTMVLPSTKMNEWVLQLVELLDA